MARAWLNALGQGPRSCVSRTVRSGRRARGRRPPQCLREARTEPVARSGRTVASLRRPPADGPPWTRARRGPREGTSSGTLATDPCRGADACAGVAPVGLTRNSHRRGIEPSGATAQLVDTRSDEGVSAATGEVFSGAHVVAPRQRHLRQASRARWPRGGQAAQQRGLEAGAVRTRCVVLEGAAAVAPSLHGTGLLSAGVPARNATLQSGRGLA